MISDIGVDDVIKFEPLRFFSSIKSSIVQMSNVVFEKQKEEEHHHNIIKHRIIPLASDQVVDSITMSEVLLVVYDLSGGMARSLSAQFLGPNHSIELIPHTGLLVFGNEYFFGGGIQSVEPHYFRAMRGIHPVQTQRLGITTVSQTAFDDWCRGVASRKYNAATYDLLHRNCNHFSHDAALQGLKLNQGVPSWILEVPHKFLSSPMGQMIRPMLEQMQISQPTAPAIQPVRGAPGATSVVVAPVFAAGPAVVNMGTLSQQSAATNPWAGNWSATNRATTAPAHAAAGTTTSSCQGSPTTTTVDVDRKPTSRAITPPVTSSRSDSVLRKYTKPMLSNDTKSLPICVAKLSPHLSDQTSTALQSLSRVLQGAVANPSGSDSTHVPMIVTALWKLIHEGRGASFALLYLRLVVLSFSSTAQVGEIMSELMTTLSDVSSTVFQTPASKSLAWCVASNYAGSTAVEKMASPIPSVLVDAAIRDWNHDSVQVRQAACTFLYNFVEANLDLYGFDVYK
jgi:hypothetical protein